MEELLLKEWGKRNEIILGPEDMDVSPLSLLTLTLFDDGGTEILSLSNSPSIIEVGVPNHLLDVDNKLWSEHHKTTPWEGVDEGIYYRLGYNIDGKLQNSLTEHIGSEKTVEIENQNGVVTAVAFIEYPSDNADVEIVINDMLIKTVDFDGQKMSVNSLADLSRIGYR